MAQKASKATKFREFLSKMDYGTILSLSMAVPLHSYQYSMMSNQFLLPADSDPIEMAA